MSNIKIDINSTDWEAFIQLNESVCGGESIDLGHPDVVSFTESHNWSSVDIYLAFQALWDLETGGRALDRYPDWWPCVGRWWTC